MGWSRDAAFRWPSEPRPKDRPGRRDRQIVIHRQGVATPSSAVVWHDQAVTSRFLTLADVAETLNISAAQAYALVRAGDLPAIKVGGRGQWRVEAAELENYISRMYAQTREFVATHPFGSESGPPAQGESGVRAGLGASPASVPVAPLD